MCCANVSLAIFAAQMSPDSLRRRGAKFVWFCHGFDGLGGFLKVVLSDSQRVYYNYVLRICLLTLRSVTIHNAAGVLCLIWLRRYLRSWARITNLHHRGF
jgi:hypothetical protein